jgi:hypothetical protein
MGLFEFTFALSAVILGLALTHIASTIHKLLLAGKRVKWALEPILLTLIVLLVIVAVWLASWSDRQVASVTIGQMLLQVAKLLTLYIAAASCLPEPRGSDPVDLGTYYDRTRLLSFGSLIVSLLLFSLYQVAIEGMPSPITFAFVFDELVYPTLYASLIFVRGRWFNILVLAFVIAYYGWTVVGYQLNG